MYPTRLDHKHVFKPCTLHIHTFESQKKSKLRPSIKSKTDILVLLTKANARYERCGRAFFQASKILTLKQTNKASNLLIIPNVLMTVPPPGPTAQKVLGGYSYASGSTPTPALSSKTR